MGKRAWCGACNMCITLPLPALPSLTPWNLQGFLCFFKKYRKVGLAFIPETSIYPEHLNENHWATLMKLPK